MSAFIVDRAEIDVIVTGLNSCGFIGAANCDVFGRLLWTENLLSLVHCYPNDRDGDRPGPIDFRDADVDTYTWTPNAAGLDAKQLVETIDSYRYQSCEHPGWEASSACKATALLRGFAIRMTGERTETSESRSVLHLPGEPTA